MCQTTAFCRSCKPIGWKQYVPLTHPQWNARWGSWHWAPGLSPQAIWGLKLCCMTVKPHTHAHIKVWDSVHWQSSDLGCAAKCEWLCQNTLLTPTRIFIPVISIKCSSWGELQLNQHDMRQPLWSTTVCLSSCDFYPRAHPLNPKAHSGNLIVDYP